MELEDVMDQERKAHSTAVSQLEGQSRILDSKARSYADQGKNSYFAKYLCMNDAKVPPFHILSQPVMSLLCLLRV